MNAAGPIEAVTFDVGGTLIEPWPSVGHVYAEVAAEHGWKNISPESLSARFTDAWQHCHDFDYTRAGWEKLVNLTFHDLQPASGRVPFFPELYERFAEAAVWHVFDDVRPTLTSLAARGVRLGVISNWDERLRALLQRLELRDCFEVLAISCETGSPKPARAIFEHAARSLGLPPAAILHVGDSWEMDVRGAAAAGFQAVHLQRGVASGKNDCIQSLTELPGRMANLIRSC